MSGKRTILRFFLQIVPMLAGAFLSPQAYGVGVDMIDVATRFAAGGLEFKNDADIVLVREDVFLSPNEVRVNYVFRAKDEQTETLVFRLPEIPADFESDYYAPSDLRGASGDIRNYLDFGVAVNDQPIIPVLHEFATVDGKDVSAKILAAGLPLMAQRFADYGTSIEKARKRHPETIQSLVAAGVLHNFGSYVGPIWRYQSVFTWRQVFPAGETVTVAIHYRPILIDARDYGPNTFLRGQSAEEVCADDALRQKVAEILSTGRHGYGIAQLVYLNTGARHGPETIDQFYLTIGPTDPEDSSDGPTLSAVCPPVVAMDQDGTRHWLVRNYVPEQDFVVTFYLFP